jgi:2-dehydropantoate 2-reductase
MFGAGVIGTIYGYALSKASNQVIHYVRPGKKKQLEKGVDISLMDGRFKPARQDHIHYDMNVVEDFKDAGHFDLLIASVRHYQLNTVLPIISRNTDSADVLIFNGNWEGIENVNRFIPKSRYLWGFPVAGGGIRMENLTARFSMRSVLEKWAGHLPHGWRELKACSSTRI